MYVHICSDGSPKHCPLCVAQGRLGLEPALSLDGWKRKENGRPLQIPKPHYRGRIWKHDTARLTLPSIRVTGPSCLLCPFASSSIPMPTIPIQIVANVIFPAHSCQCYHNITNCFSLDISSFHKIYMRRKLPIYIYVTNSVECRLAISNRSE